MAEKKEMPGLEYHSIAGIFVDGKFSLQRMWEENCVKKYRKKAYHKRAWPWLKYLSVMLRFEFSFKRKDRKGLASDIEHVIFVQKSSVLKFGLIIM